MGSTKVGRNAPCPCGSGAKFKQCCEGKELSQNTRARMGLPLVVLAVGLAGSALLFAYKGTGAGFAGIGGSAIFAGMLFVLRDPNPPRGGSGGDASAINFGR